MNSEVEERYFEWLTSRVCTPDKVVYSRLLSQLYDIDFRYTHALDANRESDGMDLRLIFADEESVPHPVMEAIMSQKQCSVLEMMIALAIRCQNEYTGNDYENEVGKAPYLFWSMIQSMGLEYNVDDGYSEEDTKFFVWRMLDRRYLKNGRGGLFTVPDINKDMTKEDIWYQMLWYVEYVLTI